ncbi:hypothetical protein ACFOZY_00840 [Chungangia koreensis]|uniref:Uncharacterized protein n=1 Tax=Chungangia koreensis TaxID=752657 RepID=A0ABV8X2U7_9LACT
MDTQQNEEKSDFQKTEELKSKIEKQIAGAVWIQTLGVFLEAVLLEKLKELSEEYNEGEEIALTGAWIQFLGLVTEGAGDTQEAFKSSLPFNFEGQPVAIIGNWLQSLGSALKAVGGEKVYLNDLLTRETDFVE